MKTCTQCHCSKEESQFQRRASAKDGLSYQCRECAAKKQKEKYWKDPEVSRALNRDYQKDNPESRRHARKKSYLKNPDKARNRHFKNTYGISLVERDKMIADQKGVCAICGLPPGKGCLSVDHDHQTEKVREMLCSACNNVLGLIKDSLSTAQSVVMYLKKHSKI